MSKWYIIGPMRGKPGCNFDAFDDAATRILARGDVPISPACIDRLMEGWGRYPPEGAEFTLEDRKRFMRRDLITILDLDSENGDGVYLLRGWEESSGSQPELYTARFIGLREEYE